jgi:hypothetical protein
VLLLRLNRVEHLREARSIALVPASFPLFDVVRIEVEENRRPFHQSSEEQVRAEKIALPRFGLHSSFWQGNLGLTVFA